VTDAKADILDTPEAGPTVIRGSILRVGSYVVGVTLSIGSSALMFRELGVVDAGRYVTVLALIAIVGGISDLGLAGIGVREYTLRHGADRNRFMRNLIGMRLSFMLAGIGLALAFAVTAGYTSSMVLGTALAGAGFSLFIFQQTLTTPLSAELRLGWISLLQLMTQLGMALGILILAIAGASLVAFLSVQLPVMIPILVLTAWLVRGRTPVVPGFEVELWRRLMREVLPYSAAIVLTVIYFRVVAIMVSLLSTQEQTGYYGVAFRVLDALTLIPPLLISSAFPLLARAARDDPARLGYAVTRLTEGMLLLGVWFGLCLGVGAEVAIDVVAGPGFEPSIEVLQILGVALVGTFLLATWGYSLLSLRRHRAILVGNLLALIVAAGAGAPLIVSEGARGGAIALTLAELTLALAYGVALYRALPTLRDVAGAVPRIALALAAALAASLLSGLPPAWAVVTATGVYFLVLAVAGGIPWEIPHALRSRREGS
jgi:O-antigen/teichoic acid export membrane protein